MPPHFKTIAYGLIALVALQFVRRVLNLLSWSIPAHKMSSFDRPSEFASRMTDKTVLLWQVVDRYVREHIDELWAAWRLTLSPGRSEDKANYDRLIALSVTRLDDIIATTTKLGDDSKSPLPFLHHRVNGYLDGACKHHFADRASSPAEFDALLQAAFYGLHIELKPLFSTPLRARYFRAHAKVPSSGKIVGSFTMRCELHDRPLGLPSLIEALLIQEICLFSPYAARANLMFLPASPDNWFLLHPCVLLTNAELTRPARALASFCGTVLLGRDALKVMFARLW